MELITDWKEGDCICDLVLDEMLRSRWLTVVLGSVPSSPNKLVVHVSRQLMELLFREVGQFGACMRSGLLRTWRHSRNVEIEVESAIRTFGKVGCQKTGQLIKVCACCCLRYGWHRRNAAFISDRTI